MKSTEQIIVIGGGLSGLYLSYLLKKQGITSTILEASPRIGGRIQTIKGLLGTPLEIGATWFSDVHENVLELMDELGLEKYPQFSKGISLFQTKSFEPPQRFFVPDSESPSYRIRGGTASLIEALINRLEIGQIKLQAKVSTIQEIGDKLHIKTTQGESYLADKVVLCLPPQLASSQLSFIPQLPVSLMTLLGSVQTWMAGAIKFTLEYSSPFWRKNDYSGMLYSHVGIITEMYDHTNFEQSKYGFTGFLNPGSASYTDALRKELVIQQLVELIGYEAGNPVAYFDKVWKDEYILEDSSLIQRPHQHHGHPLLQESQMHGKLFFCGTETAVIYGGYMEGALLAAQHVFDRL